MNGETLPKQCSFFSAFAVNFNLAPTNIPLNTFESNETATGTLWYRVCGFKSLHPEGPISSWPTRASISSTT